MNQAEKIQNQLDQSRQRLLEAIEFLPDAAWLEEGAIGQLTIADLLALIAAWEAELVTGLMRLDQGKKPGKLLAALADPGAYAARCIADNRRRDLDAIFDDFQQARAQLETWLEEFSDHDLTDPKRYKWLKGKSLAQLIAEVTYDKEMSYVPDLATFAQNWSRRNGQ